ncbi:MULTISPECIES: hypothetical protein [unclassified Bartonella]|uniref:hypothetical protein n=1 Tax=unclassified Bartonella TaxID=2645622 RepID=UPI0035D08D71
MSNDVMFWQWLGFFCPLALAFVSIYVGIRFFGFTRKDFFKGGVLAFFVGVTSKFVYAKAEHFGLAQVWFSNKWVFYILFGVVFGLILGLIFLGAKRLGFRLSFFEKD